MSREKRSNGEGHFTKLPDGRYRLLWMQGYNADGRPRRLTVTGKSKSECIKLKKARVDSLPKSGSTAFEKMTFLKLCELHLAEDLSHKDKLKPTAADRREVTINNQIKPFPIAHKQVGSVTGKDITQLIEALITKGYSVSTIEKAFNVVNSAFKWAILFDKLSFNPCEKVHRSITDRLKKLSKKGAYDPDVITLTEEESAALINEALKKTKTGKYVHQAGPSVAVLLWTGMRIGEWCALRRGDFQQIDGKACLSITKTRHYQKDRTDSEVKYYVSEGSVKNEHARVIQIDEVTAQLIEELLEQMKEKSPDAYLYVNRRGNPSNPSNLDYLVNTLYKDAGLPAEISGAHVLRRTFATNKFNQGVSIKTIAVYIGDEEATVSKHYIANRKQIRSEGKAMNYVPVPKPKEKPESEENNTKIE